MPLAPAQRGGVGRLGEVRNDSRLRQLLRHIPPPGAPLQREMHVLLAGEPGQPGTQMLPVSRDHPAPLQLARASVQVLEGQLAAVNLKRPYDAHEGPPRAPTELGQGPCSLSPCMP